MTESQFQIRSSDVANDHALTEGGHDVPFETTAPAAGVPLTCRQHAARRKVFLPLLAVVPALLLGLGAGYLAGHHEVPVVTARLADAKAAQADTQATLSDTQANLSDAQAELSSTKNSLSRAESDAETCKQAAEALNALYGQSLDALTQMNNDNYFSAMLTLGRMKRETGPALRAFKACSGKSGSSI